MNWLLHFTIKHPKTVIAITFITLIILMLPVSGITINSDLNTLIPKDDPDFIRLEEIEDEYGAGEMAVIVIHDKDVFRPEVLKIIDEIIHDIDTCQQVDRVLGLTNTQRIYGEDDAMVVEPLVKTIPSTKAESDSLFRIVQNDSLIIGKTVSRNRQNSIIMVFLKPECLDEYVTEKLEGIIKPYLDEGFDIQLGGMPIVRSHITFDIVNDVSFFIPGGVLLMALLFFFSFRSWRGVILPMSVVLFAIGGTLGLMAWLGLELNVLSSIIPIMLIAVANDYGIHLISRYYEDLEKHPELVTNQEIINNGIRHLRKPLLLAGFTTIAGFLSLQSHVLPAAKEMGILTSFGIAFAFLLSITFIPAVLMLLKRPTPKQMLHNSSSGHLARILRAIGRYSYYNRKIIIVIFAITGIIGAWGIPKIIIDSNPINYYPEKSPIQKVNAVIDGQFGGSATLSIIIEGDVKSPEVLNEIDKIQDWLQDQDIVGYSLSIGDFIKQMNQAMQNNKSEAYTIPKSRDLVSNYLLLYSFEGDTDYMSSYIDYDYKKAHLMVRIASMDVMKMRIFIDNLNTFLNENIHVKNSPKGEGFVVLLSNLIPMMINGQMRSLILSIFLVALITGIFFQSLRAALFSSIPLLYAVIMVFGFMGYFGVYLNTATSMLSAIMIGIGIDYTIHFLFRFRSEIRRGLSDIDALEISMATTGQGIVINAISVMIGFSLSMGSSFIPVFFFGWLIVISIIMCLLGALTLLPVILIINRPQFIFGNKKTILQ
jgi:uncharacterized protein